MPSLIPFLKTALFAFCFLWIPWMASAAVKVGIIADSRARPVEELLLVKLPQNAPVTLLERSKLSLINEELSLQGVIGAAGWESCDFLVLLNTFAETDGATPSLVVRVISTHTLQVIGLWRYPFVRDDPERLGEMIGARLGPLLTGDGTTTPRRIVALGLLRADSPRLTLLTESATYKLAVQLQAYSGIALVERWDVHSPAFEQWLSKTMVSDVKAPDFTLEGSLTDLGSGTGLKLMLNGAEFSVAPGSAGASVDAVIAPAAKEISDRVSSGNSRAVGLEPAQFERSARWFWKWSAFEQAAAMADTALYLGSKNTETAYLRALANLKVPMMPYVSGDLRYSRPPTEEVFTRASYGLECFLEIPVPTAKASYAERLAYLRYSEKAVTWVAETLQALYFSEKTLPGTRLERERFREMANELTERVWRFYPTVTFVSTSYVKLVEHVDFYGTNQELMVTLIGYGAFLISDPDRLTALYAEWFEELGRQEAKDYYSPLMTHIDDQRNSLHHPWFVNWTARAESSSAFASHFDALMQHKNPQVRVFASLMPYSVEPQSQSADWRRSVIWLRWLIGRISAEEDFFVVHPSPYSHEILGTIGLILSERRPYLAGRFPEADLRECLSRLLLKIPKGSRVENEWRTESMLAYLLKASEDVMQPIPRPMPVPTDEEVLKAFEHWVVAAPPLKESAQAEKTRAHEELNQAWKTRQKQEAAEAPVPALLIDANRHLILRSSAGTASTDQRIVVAQQLNLGGDFGRPISAAADEKGHVWLMFAEVKPNSFTWVELDAGMSTVLRVVRLRDLPDNGYSYGYDVFGVRGHSLFFVTYNAFYVVDLTARTWNSLDTPRMGEARVWFGRERVWLSGKPGLIYEYLADKESLKLVSSAMREPATNSLDGRKEFTVTAMFEKEETWYAWIDDGLLYRRIEERADWTELYTTRTHWRAGKPYPVDSMLQALGAGRFFSNPYETFLDVLLMDQSMSGTMHDRFSLMPLSAVLPNGQTGHMSSASFLGDKLWLLLGGKDNRAALGSIEKGTSRRTFDELSLTDRSMLFAFERGFLIPSETSSLFYLVPRELVDESYSPPASPPPPPPEAIPPSLATTASVALPVKENPLRDFTDTTGRSMKAEVLDFVEQKVTLRRSDGSVFTVPLTVFSAADMIYLIKLKAERAQATKERSGDSR